MQNLKNNERINFYENEENTCCTKILVIGAGGGGCNSVNRMIEAGVNGVEFIAVNTDKQALMKSKAPKKIQIGKNLTGGRGAGAVPEIGEKAAIENEAELRECIKGANMVFVTAGMGGGTGTGAAPVIAKLAREAGCLTVGVVTKPFLFEQRVKGKIAEEGIAKLEKMVDTMVIISNEALLTSTGDEISIMEAFHMADDVLRQAVYGISNLIVKEGVINIDFADVQTVMKNRGKAIIGIGVAQGENAACEAVDLAIANPLTELSLTDTEAKAIIVNVTGGSSLTMKNYNNVMNKISDICGEKTLVIPGQMYDPTYENKIEVTIVACGFYESKAKTEELSIEKMEELICNDEGNIEDEKKSSDNFTSIFELKEDNTKTRANMVDNREFNELLSSQLSNKKDDLTPAYTRISSLKNVNFRR
jgi:cell division protein FtsZ